MMKIIIIIINNNNNNNISIALYNKIIVLSRFTILNLFYQCKLMKQKINE